MTRAFAAAGRNREGLTLLEALLALTILALSGAIVYGFLSTAFISWTAGGEDGRKAQVAGIVADRLAQQLKSAVPARIVEAGRRKAAFDGGEDSLRFVTLLPAGVRDLRQVSYSIEGGKEGPQLVYREYPWPDKSFFEEQKPLWEERLPEITGMTAVFRTGETEDESGGKGEEWAPGGEDLPRRAEIRLVVAGKGADEERVLNVTVPLRALPLR